MKRSMMILGGLLCAAGMAMAGSLEPPGPPENGSGMYTLGQIYDYLNSGVPATSPTGFQEPSAAPTPTMHSLKELYDDIKAKFDQCDAAPEDVTPGKKFFCTNPCGWGVRTGGTPLPTCVPTVTPTPTPDWYAQYGPAGAGDVVQIGSMYVAADKDGTGSTQLPWQEGMDWADGLNWLGKDDWRMPTKDELAAICAVKDTTPGFTYSAAFWWSSTAAPGGYVWEVAFGDCFVFWNEQQSESLRVRAVRDVESTPTVTPTPVCESCKAIKTAIPSAPDGIYTIDPDGPTGDAPFQVYCDMNTAGGGWTLAGFRGHATGNCATFTRHGTVTTDFSEDTTTGSWGLSLGGGYINGGASWEEMILACGGQYPSIGSYPWTPGFKFAEAGGYRLSENWCTESESGSYLWRCSVTATYTPGNEWNSAQLWCPGHSCYIPGTGIEGANPGWRIYPNPCGHSNTSSYGYIWVR